jgi:hypothetical protein
MHFYMHSYLHKNSYSCKKWVLQVGTLQDYNAIYHSPLGSSQRWAIRALFTAKDLLPSVEPTDVEP